MPGLRKNTLGKNVFWLIDCYQKERVVKCQQTSWPEDDVKPLRPFCIHLYEAGFAEFLGHSFQAPFFLRPRGQRKAAELE